MIITQRSILLAATSAAALLACVGAPSLALAQAAPPPASEAVVDEVVVTGFRAAYANAIQSKRDSLEIIDGISSDGLGRFPDLNVGEAIQRIPGVQINREAGGRDATINLRGLPGTFALTTINGQSFAAPILNGSAPLGAFNSDIFTAVRVLKTQTAGEQPGGLSGNIDLRIIPALARKDGGSISIGNEYDTLGKLNSPNGSLSYSKHLTDDFAMFGVVAYKKERFRRDSVQVQDYDTLVAANLGMTQAQFDAAYPVATYPNGVRFPGQVRQAVKDNSGRTYSAAGGAEWQVNQQLKIGLSGYFSDRNLKSSNQYLQYVDPTASSRLTNLGPIFFIDEPNAQGVMQHNAYFNSYDYSNASITDSLRSEPSIQKARGLTADVDWQNDDWRLNASARTSWADRRSDQLEIDIVQAARTGTATNGTSGHYFSGGDKLADSTLTLITPTPSHINPGPYDQRVGTSVTQARNNNNDRFGVTGTNGRALTYVDSIQTSAERMFKGGFLKSVKAGLRYETNTFNSSGTRNTAQGINFAAITPALSIENPYVSTFGGGYIEGFNPNWVAVDIPSVLAAVTPVTLQPGQTLTQYGLVNNDADPGFSSYNFSVDNKISSAFALGLFETEVRGVRIRGNAGVRYEHTEEKVASVDTSNKTVNVLNGAGAIIGTRVVTTRTPRSFEQSYGNWLPSAVVRADLTDKITVRAAVYDTYVRPQPRDITPATVVTDPPDGAAVPTYNVVLGSASLKPYTARSYDFALEWYNRPNGLVSLTVYRKDVKGIVGPIRDINRLCPADATSLGLGHLTVVGTNCFSDIQVNIGTPAAPILTPARVVITGNENQQPVTVKGIEFNIQQNLDFLPAPFDGLGGAFNYARTTLDGTNSNGTPVTLPGVSKNNYNFIAYYETTRFGVRAVYNYRDDYDLAAGGTFNGAARSVKARGQLDMSASVNLPHDFKLSLDAFNLTNAVREEYENDYNKPRRLDVDGRAYQLTLSARF